MTSLQFALADRPLAAGARPYQVEGVSALVPGTGPRLPVSPSVSQDPAKEPCRGCGGTGIPFSGQLAWCSLCDAMPVGYRLAEPIDPPTMYRAVPGGAVLVHRVGAGWATAAEILAVLFEHWHQLTGGQRPGGQSAAWLRKTAGDLFHPYRRWPFDTSADVSQSQLRGHLAAGAIDPARTGLLCFLADLVAEAFGPTGLALPPVSGAAVRRGRTQPGH